MAEGTGDDTRIPDDVAKAAVLPESYGDERNITYPAFAWLRKNMPVGRAHVEGYDPVWLITKYDDIMSVEREPKLFNSSSGNMLLQTHAEDEFVRSANNGSTRVLDSLPFMDPPEHTQMKGLTSNWFTPKNVRRFSEQIREIAAEDVEKLMSFDGEFDWVQDFALHYPLRVIMGIFGVPLDDQPKMLELTQQFFGANDPDEQREDVEATEGQAARQFQAARDDFFDYFHQFTVDRRENPRDDLMSVIANAKIDGEFIPESFVNGSYIQVATAGHDTTSSSVSGAALAMSYDLGQLAKVREDNSLIAGLVEESVRWTSPVKHFMRTVSEDTSLRGVSMREGDRVMLNYPSANRDEDYFDNADDFDVTRSPNKHLGFGFGPHTCLGQHVAKLEMTILWEELIPKVKKIELAGEPQPLKANFVAGFKALPVKITKA
jgi:cytochrome P450